MLRRFQEICGIGCFSGCHIPRIQFERMSLIYGENCYGKSTLCDIFRSLAENDPSYITERMTVPAVSDGQNIQLSFAVPGQNNETPLAFRSGSWNSALPASLRVEVFDTDFIHRNVFTGLSIERQNHENITRFIIGESGVRTAQRISDLNTESRAVNKRTREAESSAFAGIPDLFAFLEISVQQDLPTIEKNISESLATREAEVNLAKNLETARSRPEPTVCARPESIANLVAKVSECLAATFAQVHENAELILREHLENHTTDPQISRNWVQQGKALMVRDDCPFCGQVIRGGAINLISAYRSIFNVAFEEYVSDINNALDSARREFLGTLYTPIRLCLDQNQLVIGQYPELLKKKELRDIFIRITNSYHAAIRKLDDWMTTHAYLSETLTAAIQEKKENIHQAVNPWDVASAIDQVDVLACAIDEYNGYLRQVMTVIEEFKRGLDAEQVEQRIRIAEENIRRLRLEKRRLELNEACIKYVADNARKQEIEQEGGRLQEDLEREQSAFLTRYFAAINRIFSSLGSGRFEITAEQSHRGNMPTVQLRVSFSGVPITPNRIRTFFSESDRRALAFAVFWAKIELLDAEEKIKTMVVLDDPITSFDGGRIDRTIRLIESRRNELRQVIIMSHYPDYLKMFFTRSHSNHDGLLLAVLYQNATGSQMRMANLLDFVETEHQRAFRRIATFIERSNNEDIFNDLRVYLETEVRSRYYKAIYDNNLQGEHFNTLLNELVRIGEMSSDLRQTIEPLRLTLNVDHHVWMTRSHEEKIGIAQDVIQCIYEHLSV